MHKQIERLINVLNANFGEAEVFENQHNGTHTREDGEVIPDYQLAKDLEGCLTVTIHLAKKTKREGNKMATKTEKPVYPSEALKTLMAGNTEAQAIFESADNLVREWLNLWASMDEKDRDATVAMLRGKAAK
jgi:hypothetical protein